MQTFARLPLVFMCVEEIFLHCCKTTNFCKNAFYRCGVLNGEIPHKKSLLAQTDCIGVKRMINRFSARSLARICNLLEAEYLAGEKAKLYANTLTDSVLSARMRTLSQNHAARYCALLDTLKQQ